MKVPFRNVWCYTEVEVEIGQSPCDGLVAAVRSSTCLARIEYMYSDHYDFVCPLLIMCLALGEHRFSL